MTRIFHGLGVGGKRRQERGAPRPRSPSVPLIDEQHFPVLGKRPGPVVHQGFCGIGAGSHSGHRGEDVLMAAREGGFQGIQVGHDGIQGAAQLVRQLLQGCVPAGPLGVQRPGERGNGLPVGEERFAVRNSGSRMVVEGIGDHGCEYMTGGLAYVYDADNDFDRKCNLGSVDLETVMPHSADEAELLQLIYEHYMATRSRRAYGLLNDWPEERGQFIKVFPVEYWHALAMRS